MLASYANSDGTSCRPTYAQVGEGMGLSRSGAGRAIKELVDKGWLERREIKMYGRRATLFLPCLPDVAQDMTRPTQQDGTRPATETQQCQDLPRQDGGMPDVDADDGEEPLTAAELFDLDVGHVMVASLRQAGASNDRIAAEFRDRPQVCRQFERSVAALLRAGVAPQDVVGGLCRRKVPKRGVGTYVGLLLTRCGEVRSPRRLRSVA